MIEMMVVMMMVVVMMITMIMMTITMMTTTAITFMITNCRDNVVVAAADRFQKMMRDAIFHVPGLHPAQVKSTLKCFRNRTQKQISKILLHAKRVKNS